MKKYLFIICFLWIFSPLTAFAALSRIQVFSGTNTGFASTVTTSSVTVTAGDLIVCGAEADVVGANGITVIDSKSNTWARSKSNAIAATMDVETWWSRIATGGSGYTVTATDTGGGVDSLIICEEWSGNAVVPNDVAMGATDNTGVSGALNSGATSVTAQNNEVVFGIGATTGAPNYTLGAGYTNLTRVATTFTSLGFESKTVSATGAQTATLTASVAGSWTMQVATYKELVSTAATFAFWAFSNW